MGTESHPMLCPHAVESADVISQALVGPVVEPEIDDGQISSESLRWLGLHQRREHGAHFFRLVDAHLHTSKPVRRGIGQWIRI